MTNVAFLGHGIRQVFPAKTGHVRDRIIETQGAVATEYLPDEHYQKAYFVERNRLQAALADVVIPVEASQGGGTAHTIRFARRYHRRILGVRWTGANDILADLEKAGDEIVDVFSQAGRRKMDLLFRDLAESAGHDTFALALLERRLMQEIESRNVRPKDIERFGQILRDLLKRV
jgi:predicted Rossmann fold nucleotide-binding protein DprA/Smf involved in DNA uptake